MWLVLETSLACWRPEYTIAALSVLSFGHERSSAGVGSVISAAQMFSPR